MHQCGLENVVANSGTALSEQQIRFATPLPQYLIMMVTKRYKSKHRGIDMLLGRRHEYQSSASADGDDPDSFSRKHNATEFSPAIH